MKKIIIIASALALLASSAWADPPFRIGGPRWRTDGSGSIEKGIIRISLENEGWLEFVSYVSGDQEIVTGYRMRAKLTASGLGIKAWEEHDDHLYPFHVPMPPNFDPSMGDSFTFPSITIQERDGSSRITYTMTINSETGGTMSARGGMDIDVVGWCEADMTNRLWKDGTTPPDKPDTKSGCDTGASGIVGAIAAFALRAWRRVA